METYKEHGNEKRLKRSLWIASAKLSKVLNEKEEMRKKILQMAEALSYYEDMIEEARDEGFVFTGDKK